MTVSVTLEHLRYASRNNTTLCPVARALYAVTGIVWEVAWQMISRECCLVAQSQQDRSVVIILPQSAVDFVDKFDRSGEGEPFDFEFNFVPTGEVK